MRNLKTALMHLKKDPTLELIIKTQGPLNYRPHRNLFESIVGSIIGQQLSNKAADTIYERFVDLFPNKKYTPEGILTIPKEQLRAIGTSWAKARSLHDLSQKIVDGSLQLNKLQEMADEEVVNHLVQVKGIGRWSAEMLLMFALHRPDIFPTTDVGIQNAMVKHYKLNRKHKNLTVRMLKVAKFWQPWRTVACWYLWKSLDNAPLKQ